jgi:hypothetical protein
MSRKGMKMWRIRSKEYIEMKIRWSKKRKKNKKRKKDVETITTMAHIFNTCQSLNLPLTGTCRLQSALQNTAVPLGPAHGMRGAVVGFHRAATKLIGSQVLDDINEERNLLT